MWYTGLLLFRSEHHPDSGDEPLWEETLLLIKGESEEHARTLLTQYGKSEEHEYLNQNGSKVFWKFEKIASVFEMGDILENRTELFHRFLKESEIKSIERKI
jgi:Domain of unknown function (DUF4288)